MTTSAGFRALRRANPRNLEGFTQAVERTEQVVRARIAADAAPFPSSSSRRLARVSAGATALTIAAAAVLLLAIGLPGKSHGVESASAAAEHAANVSATSAERSGSVDARITHGGATWTEVSIRWHGDDMSLAAPGRTGKAGASLIVVDGMMYTIDPEDGAWVELGPTTSIDPDSGTTPDEYLAAARYDVSGQSLQRIAGGWNGMTMTQLEDGSTVYSGTVPAGLIARESGFKDGQAIRVFPFGSVAHGAAADPDAPLDVAMTVGANGIVREIDVTWGTWAYTVRYDGLGTTPAPVAPANARPLKR